MAVRYFYRETGFSLNAFHSIMDDLFVGWIRRYYLAIQLRKESIKERKEFVVKEEGSWDPNARC